MFLQEGAWLTAFPCGHAFSAALKELFFLILWTGVLLIPSGSSREIPLSQGPQEEGEYETSPHILAPALQLAGDLHSG